jgi:hypothetical protein
MAGYEVRLGHAVRTDDNDDDAALTLALGVASATAKLEHRPPREPSAVLAAEQVLGSPIRPIYAYVGSLHPDLGTVGMVIAPTWGKRCIRGTSRCDSGGLMGGFGGFACVTNKVSSLQSVFYAGTALARWESDFRAEVVSSYAAAEPDYVRGAVPDSKGWRDVRAQCIQFVRTAMGILDRRLWTWEAWLEGTPLAGEVECLVLSPEMRKRLERLRHAGMKVPTSIRILPGRVRPSGVHWFHAKSVYAAFLGRRRWPK